MDVNKKKLTFEIKKKVYNAPNLKKYGSFSEMTKGQGLQGDQADGQTYYGQDLNS